MNNNERLKDDNSTVSIQDNEKESPMEIPKAEKQKKMEEKKIPEDVDYNEISNLALEAKQKLSAIRPLTIGQASRISGINPADISVLLIYLKQKYNEE